MKRPGGGKLVPTTRFRTVTRLNAQCHIQLPKFGYLLLAARELLTERGEGLIGGQRAGRLLVGLSRRRRSGVASSSRSTGAGDTRSGNRLSLGGLVVSDASSLNLLGVLLPTSAS